MLALGVLILAGGGARRLGGVNKCWLEVGGVPSLELLVKSVLGWAATAGIWVPNQSLVPVIVVGPQPTSKTVAGESGPLGVRLPARLDRRPLWEQVGWARENPPGSGPVAAIAAGLAELERQTPAGQPDRLLLLAGDMPFAAAGLGSLFADLLPEAVPTPDAIIGVDVDGRDQYLFANWKFDALREAIRQAAIDGPVRQLYRSENIRRVPLPPLAALDCDTPADLALARQLSPYPPVKYGFGGTGIDASRLDTTADDIIPELFRGCPRHTFILPARVSPHRQ